MSARYFARTAPGEPFPDVEAARPLEQLEMVLLQGTPGPDDRPLMTDEAKLLTALDQLLGDRAQLEADVRPNGNPDVFKPGLDGVPAYPVLRRTPAGPVVDFEQVVRATPMGRIAALNLSLGTSRYVTYRPDLAVNVATRAVAAHCPVVAAAGNEGADARGRETLSAWAQPPWVISVTATEEPGGGPVSPRSSVGDPDDPATWPTVMSYGASRRDAERFGTSFAAPRVARQLALFSAFLDGLRAVAAQVLGAGAFGAPLPVVQIVDKGLDVRSAAPTLELSAVPLGFIDPERLGAVLARAGVQALPPAPPRAAQLRELLLSSARAVAGSKPHEVGHGFVDDTTTRERLLRFSERDGLIALGITPTEAATATLVEADLVEPLIGVLAASLLMQGADLDGFEDAIRPRLIETPPAPNADSVLRLEAIRNA